MYCSKCGTPVQGSYCNQCGHLSTVPFYRKIPGFRSGAKWKMVIASIGYGFLGLILLGLILPTPPSKPTPYTPPAAPASVPEKKEIPAGIAKQLEVKVEVQDTLDSKNNNKVVIWVKNNSDYLVSGSVEVRLKDAAKNTVSSDTVYFNNVPAKRATHAISWLKAFRVTQYEWEVKVKEAI